MFILTSNLILSKILEISIDVNPVYECGNGKIEY